MSTPESTPTNLPWALGIGQPYARDDLNPMPESTSGNMDLAYELGQGLYRGLKKCQRINKPQTQVNLKLNLVSVH